MVARSAPAPTVSPPEAAGVRALLGGTATESEAITATAPSTDADLVHETRRQAIGATPHSPCCPTVDRCVPDRRPGRASGEITVGPTGCPVNGGGRQLETVGAAPSMVSSRWVPPSEQASTAPP